MTMTDRRFLEAQLASLLSFEIEDAEDVIEHLLAFDSENDLLEHMCALLGVGEDNNEVKQFVSNIMKFQKGLPIDVNMDMDIPDVKETFDHKTNETTTKHHNFNPNPTLSKRQQESIQTEKEKKEKRQQQEKDRLRQLKEEKEQLAKLERMRLEQMKALEELRAAQAKEDAKIQEELRQAQEQAQAMTMSQSQSSLSKPQRSSDQSKETASSAAKRKKKKEPTTTKPKPPPTGKATVICGCFGTIHKPLTNCLRCGRISCRKEGYGYCPHCTHLIEKAPVGTAAKLKSGSGSSSSEAFEKAMLHKERLLKFDKESASRTVVYDDQADYFQNETSMWLTNEEQKENSIKEEKRRKDMHTIKKHVLKINF